MPDHEIALLAAVLLAQRAQAGEDVTEATERLAELAGGEEEGEEDGADDQDAVSAFAETASFTGEITDSIGRKRCYQDGKQVPCHEGDEAGQDTGKGKEGAGKRSLRTHGLASLPAVAKLEQMAKDVVTGKGPPPSGPVGKALARAAGWVGEALHKVEHAALLIPKLLAHAIIDDVAGVVHGAPMPDAVRKTVLVGWALAKVGGAHAGRGAMALAFANWTLAQKAVEQIAVEKGATAEEARQIRGALSAVDMKTFEVLKVSAVSGVHAAHLPLAVMYPFPPATTAYLAYNFAAHPLATLQAAKALVKGAAALIPKQEIRDIHAYAEGVPEDALRRSREVAGALEAHGYEDWYFALLMAALEETGTMAKAVEVANESYRRQPKDPSAGQGGQADAGSFGEWDPQKHPHGQHGHWASKGMPAVKPREEWALDRQMVRELKGDYASMSAREIETTLEGDGMSAYDLIKGGAREYKRLMDWGEKNLPEEVDGLAWEDWVQAEFNRRYPLKDLAAMLHAAINGQADTEG